MRMDMTEVRSAEQATEIAVDFLKKHWVWSRPLSATRTDDLWEVRVDVGPLRTQIAIVHIAAKTGEIRDYTIPGEGGAK